LLQNSRHETSSFDLVMTTVSVLPIQIEWVLERLTGQFSRAMATALP
jgi:hypothetical protein